MSPSARPAVLVAALLSASCLDVSGSREFTFPFDFSVPGSGIGDGWTVAVADVPAARVTEVEVAGELSTLPSPFTAFTGLRESGTNVSGTLFVFHKKWIQSPWSPGTTYYATIDMAILTNQHAGCPTGAGPLVLIKAGVSGVEPVVAPDAEGVLRLSLDKGTGASGGGFAQLGDIRNSLTDCPAEGIWQARGTLRVNQSLPLVIDGDGGFWIFFGTQSTYNGRHELYFTQFRVTLSFEP